MTPVGQKVEAIRVVRIMQRALCVLHLRTEAARPAMRWSSPGEASGGTSARLGRESGWSCVPSPEGEYLVLQS